MKTVIIGSGITGLTAGAYLAKAGHEVIVYEQFPTPGGVTVTLKQDGFSWDIGPLLLDGFAPGDKGRIVLEELGVSEKVKMIRADRGLVMRDIALWKPEVYAGPYWRRERLKEIFPGESAHLDGYYRFYDHMLALMALARRSENAEGLAGLWLKLRMLIAFQGVRKYVKWNGAQLMDHFFDSPVLKTIFLGLAADFVTAPVEFPALGIPTLHIETAFDKRIPAFPNTESAQVAYYYFADGCQNLVGAVMGVITTNGGRVITNAPVKCIVIEEGTVKGVELADGHFEPADRVLASGGMREVFFDLVGRKHLPAELTEQVEKNRLMESVFMVQLGIDFDPAPYQRAALCYYYETTDLDDSVQRLRAGDYHEGREGLLIYVPSKHSPSMAPTGKHAVTIYTVAPDKLKEGGWTSRREEFADKLVAEAEKHVPGLRAHTLTRMILTPDDFRKRTHQTHHSFGGVPPVMGNQPPANKTPINGLWFIGSQSESGAGILNVVVGAQKVAKRILAGE